MWYGMGRSIRYRRNGVGCGNMVGIGQLVWTTRFRIAHVHTDDDADVATAWIGYSTASLGRILHDRDGAIPSRADFRSSITCGSGLMAADMVMRQGRTSFPIPDRGDVHRKLRSLGQNNRHQQKLPRTSRTDSARHTLPTRSFTSVCIKEQLRNVNCVPASTLRMCPLPSRSAP
jgi:hypothetical protein